MKIFVKNKKGQNSAVEYTITFFLVVASIMAMSTYTKRVLQAKTRDALYFMANTVAADYAGMAVATGGNFRFQYEPYYQMANAEKVVDTNDVYLDGASLPLSSGIFTHDMDQTISTVKNQTQIPPHLAY